MSMDEYVGEWIQIFTGNRYEEKEEECEKNREWGEGERDRGDEGNRG